MRTLLVFPVVALMVSFSCASAEEEPRYAVTSSTMTGPKGTISLIQVTFVDGQFAKAQCEGALQSNRETKGAALITDQQCTTTLPPAIAPAEHGDPILGSYVVYWKNSFLFAQARGMHIVSYSFDPGPEAATCERYIAKYRSIDPEAKCIPPKH